jgi:hypothetical protein
MDAFGGRPVWLASLSRRKSNGSIIATGDWLFKMGLKAEAERLVRQALKGVGDERFERLFRMNITYCLHRALSEDEVAGLPAAWERAPGGLAGGPVEVLWQRGIPDDLQAAKCCENPHRMVVIPSRPDLWVPTDCGKCPPCLARAEVERGVQERAAQERAAQERAARRVGPPQGALGAGV